MIEKPEKHILHMDSQVFVVLKKQMLLFATVF